MVKAKKNSEIHRIDFGDYFAPQYPASILAFGQIDGQNIQWKRENNGGRTTTKDAKSISEIASTP